MAALKRSIHFSMALNIAMILSLSSILLSNKAGASSVGTPGPYSVTIKPPVKYAKPDADSLIECKPNWRGDRYAGPRPVVMLIHGGAWIGGSNAVNGDSNGSGRWCSLWASWGFDTFSVGYRLTKVAPWPAQIVDVQASIRWVRAHAKTLHINPGMIVVNGDSAGGQLAMIAGYSSGIIPGDLSQEYPAISPQPQLVISQFGPWTFGPAQPPGAPSARAMDYAAGILRDNADGRTRQTTPNTLFVQGTQDTTVNQCTQSEPAYRFLIANNRPASYLAYKGGHEFTGMNSATWSSVVGAIQLKTISFAYARSHFAGVLPASERGPQTAFADLLLPQGCP